MMNQPALRLDDMVGIGLPPWSLDLQAPSVSRSSVPAKRIALVHDWCPDFRGGERVLSQFCQMMPGAEVYTLFDFLPDDIKRRHFPGVEFSTSIANRLPMIEKYYRALFFLCPFLVEQFDVTEHDMVISSSAAFSRGVLTRPDQPHMCYVLSPMRYAWDEQFSYLQQGRMGYGPIGLLYRWLLHNMRTWDVRTAHGPDVMVAVSNYVRARIRRVYGRDALVVFPPVAINEFELVTQKDDYYVTASFLAPYKRMDLVIQAFNDMPARRLLVVGQGQDAAKLLAMAGPNISFTGYLPRADYVAAVANAKAMVFAGCEDFGIALAEAQACGTPMIAFGRGGARDIVVPLGGAPQPTGVLFGRQTVSAVKDAVDYFENNRSAIHPEFCRSNANRFSTQNFERGINHAIEATLKVAAQR